MEMIKGLNEAHRNADRLEQELNKCRSELIAAYENKSSNDLYTLKITYATFGEVHRKETAKFNALLNKLDESDFIFNDNDSEITENTESASVVNAPMANESEYSNADIGLDTTQDTPKETEQTATNESKNCETETGTFTELYHESETETQEIADEKSLIIPADISEKSEAEFPVLNANMKRRTANTDAPMYGTKISKVKSGYKYKGHGFTVFTNYRNKCKPIYSSTMLFCRETCNENKADLKDYLVQNGKFRAEMIEGIFFKTRGYYNRYALVKVRGPLSYIKKKMKTLNKAKNGQIIRVFKLSNSRSANDDPNQILFVNNFDILQKDMHRKFTKLFLKHGELVKDIRMGLDSHRDPYAIVHFRDLSDAANCVGSEMKFGGKVLSVKFSTQQF